MENLNNKFGERKEGFDKAAFTKVVWAGRRRYFFDVLSTKAGEKYLSITESRRKLMKDGSSQFENQKLFLFKEDFEKFANALTEVLDYIGDNYPENNVKLDSPKEEVKCDEELERFKATELNFENL
ncbi:MAG: DUF3276 family protein [Rikenellaceae bacterium]